MSIMSDAKWIESVPSGLVNFLDGPLFFVLKIKLCCPIHAQSGVCRCSKLLCTTSLNATNSQNSVVLIVELCYFVISNIY
jgi:hypothetical protein